MGRSFAVLLTLAAAATIVVLVDAGTRGLVRDQLADRLPQAPELAAAELAELTRQAAATDDGALAHLVAAALDEDPAVAAAAQNQIDSLLDEWRFGRARLEGDRLRERLATIAAGLRAGWSGAAPEWAAATARRLLRLANALPNAAAPAAAAARLVDDCDAVLAAAAVATPPRPVELAPQTAEAPLPTPTADEPSTLPTPSPSAEPLRVAIDPGVAEPAPEPAPFQPPKPLAWRSSERRQKTLTHVPSGPPLTPRPVGTPPRDDWDPNWAPPTPPPVAAAGPTETFSLPPAPESFEGLSDRELLRRFLPIATAAARKPLAIGPRGRASAAEETAVETSEGLLRQAVIDRGYGRLATRHLRMLLSPDARQRGALVNELLTTRSGSAARVLLLLASDESPAVRHNAIRSLGSSTNPQLVEAAWRLAVEDRDPRVARLAHELNGSGRSSR